MESGIKPRVIQKVTSILFMLMAAVVVIIVSNLQIPNAIPEDQSLTVVANDFSSKPKESIQSMSIELVAPKEEVQEVVSISLLPNELRTAAKVSEYDKQVLANVNESLNVRNQPSIDGEIVGKMLKGSTGQILERSNGFTKITSGSVEGWVSDEFLIFGAEIEKKVIELGLLEARIVTETLKVRKYADIEAPTLDLCGNGDTFTVLEELGDWVKIRYSADEFGYIKAEFADVYIKKITAITLEEEQAAIQAAEQKAAAQRMKNASNEQEMRVFAACVMMEAGGYSYDGQLAVANVILNRVRSGRWGNSITSVIYAKGQFPGAASGLLDTYLAKGASSSVLKAINDAMSGNNNIGDYLFFNSTKAAKYSTYTQYVVVDGNCFYKK